MYMVSLRKISDIAITPEKQITIQTEPYQTKVYARGTKAQHQFDQWSREHYEGREYVIDKIEASFFSIFRALLTKHKTIPMSGTGKLSVDPGGFKTFYLHS